MPEVLGCGTGGVVTRNNGTVTKVLFNKSCFEHEVSILNHVFDVPHVVTMLSNSPSDMQITFVYEGDTLYDCRNVFCKDWEPIMHQVFVAVHFMHMRRIIHGDIKMENILVNERGTVKLCDFGHSRVLADDEVNTSTLTQLRGTLSYTCPEILKGQRYNGFNADAWSVGVVLYCLVMDSFPFSAAAAGRPDYDFFIMLMSKGKVPSDALLDMWGHAISSMAEKTTPLFAETLNRLLQPEPWKRFRFAD